jgi:DNA-binding LacI/PurR family transcriptional regulator
MLTKSIKLKQAAPIYRQIILQIEEMIKKGEIKPGSRIASTFDFARQFNIANQTAQNALKELTNRGILKRTPRKGTFVSENLSSGTIAMFSERNPFTDQHMAFSRLFCAAAFNYAGENGWNLKLYFPHNKEDLFKTVSDLEKDINDNKIRAVFGLHSDKLSEWFTKNCSVPYVLFEDAEAYCTMEYFIYEGLKYLCGRGYSRIALIFSDSNERLGKEVKRGIEKVKNEISGRIDIKLWLTKGNTPGEARALMHGKLNKKTALPEAFLVLDDVIASGVIFALQEKNIRIPEQAALLTLSVKGIELLSPAPLTRIEYDPEELMRKSFELLFDKLNGRKSSPCRKYCPALIVGKSCGE